MRDVTADLKSLRLYGMAAAWRDLVEQGSQTSLESAGWLIEHLLQAETSDRAMRSVNYQMGAAKFPVHRDLAGFDFEVSPVDRKLVGTLATAAFTWLAGLRLARTFLRWFAREISSASSLLLRPSRLTLIRGNPRC